LHPWEFGQNGIEEWVVPGFDDYRRHDCPRGQYDWDGTAFTTTMQMRALTMATTRVIVMTTSSIDNNNNGIGDV